jgi:hypothetical protein
MEQPNRNALCLFYWLAALFPLFAQSSPLLPAFTPPSPSFASLCQMSIQPPLVDRHPARGWLDLSGQFRFGDNHDNFSGAV